MDKSQKVEKLGSSKTEAWADTKTLEKESKVNIPSQTAVEDAKEWVEENEK
ncbi:CDIF630_02480 family spore surface protein [Fusibacter tunisiensis]|uniref:DUF3787 domain-containing protein n=1 Tax=Fusibacter tunisiensis TaxID=1008308 RepID=A0ABS2MPC6_9FIRM|nr:DUF3787 domain-containing protein [Fusibacter tunisiensis]MBM7561253.1 hypothetical protein [Fusibacter tunisiensis]